MCVCVCMRFFFSSGACSALCVFLCFSASRLAVRSMLLFLRSVRQTQTRKSGVSNGARPHTHTYAKLPGVTRTTGLHRQRFFFFSRAREREGRFDVERRKGCLKDALVFLYRSSSVSALLEVRASVHILLREGSGHSSNCKHACARGYAYNAHTHTDVRFLVLPFSARIALRGTDRIDTEPLTSHFLCFLP